MPEFESKVPTLYIFSGLPGSGKSTLSQLVARQLKAVYLRIDTIEQGLRELCSLDVQGEGYRLAYRIALDNLRLGVSVVADSCNPIQLTRREWEQVARDARAEYINIEIVCSDSNEHRLRAESRVAGVSGLRLPTWREIENREYDVWTVERVIVDTAGRSEAECARDLFSKLTPLRAESIITADATRRHVDAADM
ncbi:MAG: AAA family ATPase [Proteobacteria bacterium]|nr:AAA family ATPase [Pseudomonadota bacterium]